VFATWDDSRIEFIYLRSKVSLEISSSYLIAMEILFVEVAFASQQLSQSWECHRMQ
jgi:hypothetical protein